MNNKSTIFELTPKRKLLIILANFMLTVLFGTICIGRNELLALALDGERHLGYGSLLMLFGVICSFLSSLLIIRQIRKLHGEGSDKGIHIGKLRFKPVLFISAILVVGIFSFGAGFGVAFQELPSYAICLMIILVSLMVAVFGLVIMALGKKKVNLVFSLISCALCTVFIVFLGAKIPAVAKDMTGGDDAARTVKASVVSVEQSMGRITSPGAQKVTIKSSSAEHVTFFCPVQAAELEKGRSYVFTYYENTLYCSQWQEIPDEQSLTDQN